MKHPDIYGALYALSPCCLGWGSDLSLANPAWDKTLHFKTMNDFWKAENDLCAASESVSGTG